MNGNACHMGVGRLSSDYVSRVITVKGEKIYQLMSNKMLPQQKLSPSSLWVQFHHEVFLMAKPLVVVHMVAVLAAMPLVAIDYLECLPLL